MFKIKPERVAGIVAMSYLVLIPAGGIVAMLKLRAMDKDITTLWNHLEINPKEAAPGVVQSIDELRQTVLRRQQQ